MKNVRKSWARLTMILGREGANLRVSRIFFNMVVQAVLLFGSETWVLNPRMEWDLVSFHQTVARRITGRQPRRQDEGGWYYPYLETAMKESVFEEIGV